MRAVLFLLGGLGLFISLPLLGKVVFTFPLLLAVPCGVLLFCAAGLSCLLMRRGR